MEYATRQPLAAPAARCLDRDRQPVFAHGSFCVGDGVERRRSARHDGHARCDHGLARAQLVAHRLDGAGVGADPHEPGAGHGARERRVLGEETVAGVDGVGAGAARDVEYALDVQVALRGRGRPEQIRLVGVGDVGGVAVGFGVNGDGRDAEFLAPNA